MLKIRFGPGLAAIRAENPPIRLHALPLIRDAGMRPSRSERGPQQRRRNAEGPIELVHDDTVGAAHELFLPLHQTQGDEPPSCGSNILRGKPGAVANCLIVGPGIQLSGLLELPQIAAIQVANRHRPRIGFELDRLQAP